MLYFLHELSADGLSAFTIFKAVTFRAAFASVFAFLIAVTLGSHVIAYLRRRKVEEDVAKKDSEFLKEKHACKKNTPTMGGVILIGATLLSVALFARPDVIFVPLAFFTMLGLALVGFYDDWIKLKETGKDGQIGRASCRERVYVLV